MLIKTKDDVQLEEAGDSCICGTDDGWLRLYATEKKARTVGFALENCGILVSFFYVVLLRSYPDSVLMRSVLDQLSSVSVERILPVVSDRLVLCIYFFVSDYADETRIARALSEQS